MRDFSATRPLDRRRRWITALICSALLGSCDGPFPAEVEEVVRVDINPPVLTMVVGGNATLTAQVYGAGNNLLPGASVFWSSQDPDVVTITQAGVATALSAGTAQIAASAGGQSRTIAVTVSQVPIALVRITPPAGNVAVGATLALQGEALDGTGALLPNRLLEWSSSAPHIASVNGTGIVTGVAVGEATITATGEEKTGTALVTVLPAPIATISIAPNGGALPVGSTMQLVATPRDADGQVLTGRSVEWRSSNEAVATVSSSGLLTAITPGTVTISVSAPGGGVNGTTPTASVSVTVLIEPVATAVIVPSTTSVQVGQNVDLTVNLFNSRGEPLSVAGRTIGWSTSNTAIATINSSGTVTGVSVGSVTVTATITTPAQSGSVQAAAQVTVTTQSATQLAITVQPPASANSGQIFSSAPVVQLRDGAGNNVLQAGVLITASVQPGAGATLGGGSATTNASGSATFGALTLNGPAGTYTLRFSSGALPPVTSSPVILGAGSGSRLALTVQPSTTAPSGTPFAIQPQVQLQDGSGNAVAQSGVVVTAVILTGGGTLGGTATATTNSSGVAAFSNLSITGSAGVRTLLFAADGYTTVTSNPIDITVAPTALAITTQPSATAQSGIPFVTQPAVQLRDAGNNPVSQAGIIVTASIASGAGATLVGSNTASTDGSGIATFSGLGLTGTVGTFTLQFSSAGLTSATSAAVSLTPGPAAGLAMAVEPPGTASSGAAFSTAPAVRLVDASGNAVSLAGVTVGAAVTGGGASLVGSPNATTNAAGVATFTGLGISGVGTWTLEFSSAGLTSVTSSAVAVSLSASQLSMVSQPSATAQSGQVFAAQPTVRLRDAGGNPVNQSGVQVTAEITGGGAALLGTASVSTDASGTASFSNLGIAGTVGSYTLTFRSSGLTSAVSAPVGLTAGAPARLQITVQPSGTTSGTLSTQPVIQVVDAHDNIAAAAGIDVTATLNVITGTGSLTGAVTITTDAFGQATFGNLGIDAPGSYTLTFIAGGLTAVTSQSLVIAFHYSRAQPLVVDAPSGYPITGDGGTSLVDGNKVSEPDSRLREQAEGGFWDAVASHPHSAVFGCPSRNHQTLKDS